ncbi:hypothetical protein CQA66_06385 [Helicobacter aurati]|uniref:Uncharacterized protein n=1 Tax=Helicobacter aurati TaxID=137778 RepID=A0A3D8J223_9HELI|nr:hypothetical protein [Helicobacter aurati]RDU71582.1 hypothetical protein CQA66_06385 [Helicobacter aurati]
MRHSLSNSYCRIFSLCSSLSLLFLWLFNSAFTIEAKDIAESFMRFMAKDNSYSCEGDRFKATCSAPKIMIANDSTSTTAIKNLKITTALNNKNASFHMSGNIQITDQEITATQKPFLPQRFQCSTQYSVQKVTMAQEINCQIDSSIYTLLLNNLLDIQSENFQSKNFDEIIDSLATISENTTEKELKNILSKFRVNPKQITIQLKGSKLGDSLFQAMKTTQPDMTRESYNSTIALGAAMIPASLAQFKEITSETNANLSKAGGAIADVLISRKESAKITLKRKTTTPLNFADLPAFIQKADSNIEYLLAILNDYQITSSTE